MDDGNRAQPGVVIVLLPISSVDPLTMLRFLGGVALAAAAVMLAWAEQSQSQPDQSRPLRPEAPVDRPSKDRG